MAKVIINKLLPWEDRWNEPTLDELWAPNKEHHQRLLQGIYEGVTQFEGMERTLAWHGEGWKWTIEFNMPELGLGGKANGEDALAYIVPRPETPIVCVPLTDEQVETFPMRRLNRVVREGIKGAKQSVDIRWCKYTPSQPGEVDHLLDLIKRKIKAIKAAE